MMALCLDCGAFLNYPDRGGRKLADQHCTGCGGNRFRRSSWAERDAALDGLGSPVRHEPGQMPAGLPA
jgi:predicted  nucleic acid-binding Zn-ribbon protein